MYYESLETVGIKLHSKFMESCGLGVGSMRASLLDTRDTRAVMVPPGADSVYTLGLTTARWSRCPVPMAGGRGHFCPRHE